MPDTYLLLKVLHILGSTVLFGTGIGTAFHFWMANRSGDVAAIHQSARITVIADLAFTTPAVVVQPATGIALAAMAGFPLASTWLVASFVLYGIAGACWLPVVAMQIRMRNLAAQSLREAKLLPAESHRLARAWFLLGWPAFASLLGVFWLMVAKPA